MRIAIASRVYSPEPAAASFRLGALAAALAMAGNSVMVLTVKAFEGTAPDVPGVDVRRVPVLRDATGTVRGYVQYLSFDIPLIFRLFFCRRPDVVVSEPPPTTGFMVRLVLTIRRIPYVYYAADVWSDATAAMGAPRFVVWALRTVERFALRGAARVIAVSDGVADRVRDLAGHDRVVVVRNGVDTDTFTTDGPTDDLGATAVYAGTMSEWQGAEIFIKALPKVRASVPDARLLFLGQGSAMAELQGIVAELGLEGAVEFGGLVPPVEAARALRSAAAALVSLKPGQGYDFAVPTKLFAGAACGAPVIFAGDGDSREVIAQSGIGVAVSYDVDAVAEALTEAFRSPANPSRRAEVAAWVLDNASIAATGREAADHVESAAPRSTS
jgi:glycosyltransferase involved in cell wall biosynthesis